MSEKLKSEIKREKKAQAKNALEGKGYSNIQINE